MTESRCLMKTRTNLVSVRVDRPAIYSDRLLCGVIRTGFPVSRSSLLGAIV